MRKIIWNYSVRRGYRSILSKYFISQKAIQHTPTNIT